jgi:hypothetical protein
VGAIRVRSGKRRLSPRRITRVQSRQLDGLRAELARRATIAKPVRWNARPEDAQRALAKLLLALAEFLRKLLERQAIRRMDAGSLTPAQIEAMGLALMRLERTIVELARRFKIRPEELNLDLGPLGRLL